MYGERRPEFDPDQFVQQLRGSWDRLRSRLPGGGNSSIIAVLAVLLVGVLWMGSGVYTVDPEQQAAVRLFGKFRGTEGPGLKWYFPSPIGTVNIENVQTPRTMELGFRASGLDVPVEALMITGDLNIVDVQLVVQYRISNIRDYLFNVDDPGDPDRDPQEGRPDGRTLKDATEASLRQVVGQRGIDDVLTVGKEAVQVDTGILLQQILDDYGTGIEIVSVVLQEVTPPDEVRAAFDDVVSARSDRETRINQANAYQQDRIPRAQGAAQQTVQTAEGFKKSRIARARGEAAEFLAVLQEYEASKDVTRKRLYLEAIEEILPSVELYVIDKDAGSGVLPFLPLNGVSSSTSPSGGGS